MQTERRSWSSWTVALIGISAAMRLVLAWVLGLGVDESYEVVLSRVPSLGYFDHPPLSFWMAGVAARLAGTEHRVVLRLPFILVFAATTWLLFRLTARLYGERAGFLAALLLNVSPVFSLSTGGWILPDGPLDCAVIAAAACLTRVLVDGDGLEGGSSRHVSGDSEHRETRWRWWLGAGIATGVALLSKLHGGFVLAGTLLFLITRRKARPWLRRPEPYVAALVALVVASPAIIWNVQHGFASVRFQAGRAASHGIHPAALAQNVAGQLGYLLPWIGVPLLWQLWRGLRAGPGDAGRWLLLCLAVGPIVVFTLVSLGGNPGLPHWAAPGYLLLFPLVGEAAARFEHRGPREHILIRRALVAATIAFAGLTTIAATAVATGWPARIAPALFARGDPTLEALDWSDLRPELEQRGVLSAGDVVITTHWIDGAKAGYALGRSYDVFCFSDDPRGFQYSYPPRDAVGRDAIVLARVAEGRPLGDPMAKVARYVRSIEPAAGVSITRAGRVAIEVLVFRARGVWRVYTPGAP